MSARGPIVAILALAVSAPAAAQVSAPFCMVTNTHSFCHYYSLDACRAAQAGLSGQCVANPQRILEQQQQFQPRPLQTPPQPVYQPQPQQQGGSVFDSFARGAQLGMQEREARMAEERAQELHAVEMKEAQLRLQAPPPAPPAGQGAPLGPHIVVLYSCPLPNDGVQYTTTPTVGCTVVSITPVQ